MNCVEFDRGRSLLKLTTTNIDLRGCVMHFHQFMRFEGQTKLFEKSSIAPASIGLKTMQALLFARMSHFIGQSILRTSIELEFCKDFFLIPEQHVVIF